MAYSCRPSCSAAVPDPARFRHSRAGHLVCGSPTHGSPAAGHFRSIPAPVLAACLFLVLVIAALLVQAVSLQPILAPPAANASVSPSPAPVPEMSATGPAITGTPPARATARNSTGPTAINATLLAVRVHELVNQVRQENGRSVLGMDPALASIARAHSTDMAAHGYFGHVNLDERDATARGAAAGYTCHRESDPYYTCAIAENIFATYRHSTILLVNGRAVESEGKSEEEIAQETVDAWVNSPDHRENLLDPGVKREGIGVAIAKDDLVFVTEDFC